MSSAQQLDGESLESKVVIARKELERMRETQKNSFNKYDIETDEGIGMLLEAYIKARGSFRSNYLRDESEYVKGEDVSWGTIQSWMRGSSPFRLRHMKGLVDELGVSEEHLYHVAGRDPFKPTEKELEEWSKDEKGVGKLLGFYVDLRSGEPVSYYLENRSDYRRDNKINTATITGWVKGHKSIPLKHLKGIVDELEIPERDLEKVCGRDLSFKPTDGELEEWSREERGIGKLLGHYISLRHGVSLRKYIMKKSDYSKEEVLNYSTVQAWFDGRISFPLKYMKGIVDELDVPENELIKICGRNPIEVTEKDLQRWSEKEEGVGNLLKFYADLNLGLNQTTYIHDKSEYAKSNDISINQLYAWFSGKNTFPPEYLKGFADEIGVPYDQVKKVSGIDLGVEGITREQLEEMRREQVDNPDKGIGMLLDSYIKAKGDNKKGYLENSGYMKRERLNVGSVSNNFLGGRPFRLKHLNGLADELGVDQEELEFVAGRNPFEVTEEELERWSEDDYGVGKLLSFYIDLNYGLPTTVYLSDKSNYRKANDIKVGTINNWNKGQAPFPPEHLRGFADEIGVPYDQVKKVSGIDLEEITVLTREERLEEMRRVQEESKHSKGVGMLLDMYIGEEGKSRDRYLRGSEYIREERLKPTTASRWFMGISQFHLKHMKKFVDDLGVDQRELEMVCGKNPFEVTGDDLEEWSRDEKGVRKLFEFYISLKYATTLGKYLTHNSKQVEGVGVTVTMIRYWFNGEYDFPPQHLKGFAEELGVPYYQVERVSGIDIGRVKSVEDELTEAFVRYLDE